MIFERIIRLPWWLFAALSVLFLGAALAGGDWAKERGSAIRAAMERPSAPVVAFSALAVGNPAYSEAAFEAQVVREAVRAITRDEEGEERDIGTLIPLTDTASTAWSGRIDAAIVLPTGPMRPEWSEWIAPFTTGEGPLGPIMSLEGEIADHHEARDAVAATLGADAVRGAIWVRPYRDGRAVALERSLGLLGWGTLPFWGIGIFFATMSVARFFASRGD